MGAPARAVMFKTGKGVFSSYVQLPLCEGENWALGDVTRLSELVALQEIFPTLKSCKMLSDTSL